MVGKRKGKEVSVARKGPKGVGDVGGRSLETVLRAAVVYFIREGDGLAAKVFTRRLVKVVEGREQDGD